VLIGFELLDQTCFLIVRFFDFNLVVGRFVESVLLKKAHLSLFKLLLTLANRTIKRTNAIKPPKTMKTMVKINRTSLFVSLSRLENQDWNIRSSFKRKITLNYDEFCVGRLCWGAQSAN
jgi:hypothetical protein